MDRLVSRQRWSRSKEKQRCLKRARSLMLTHGITAPDERWDNDSWKILQKHLPAPLAAQVGYWRGIGLEIQKGLDALTEELRKSGHKRNASDPETPRPHCDRGWRNQARADKNGRSHHEGWKSVWHQSKGNLSQRAKFHENIPLLGN